jgi:hypothetical protein
MMALAWLKGFSLRQYAEAAAVVGLFLFVMYWDHLKIQQGRDECEAKYAAAETAAQAKAENLQAQLDHDAAAHDKALHDAIAAVPHAVPIVAFGPACKLTAAQLKQINGALQ